MFLLCHPATIHVSMSVFLVLENSNIANYVYFRLIRLLVGGYWKKLVFIVLLVVLLTINRKRLILF